MKLLKLVQRVQFRRRLNSLKWKFVHSYGSFFALKRFSALSEWFYPQPLTWRRDTWLPELTPRRKLIPWYFMSLVAISCNLGLFYIGLREILSHKKDPEMTLTQVLLLVFYTCGASLISVGILSYVQEGDGLCFALGNLQVIKPVREDDGMSKFLKKILWNHK